VRAPCDCATREIAGESVVLLRDHEGALRAFHNVCQHRAHRLLEGEGRLKPTITCPYHGWTYGLDGCLRAARGTEGLSGFDRAEFGLKRVRVEAF
jgi:phenylpropionate dioxygenase-like ring-hydroxylating dioxygenase large terminal subunit